jgi:hypothetical protein
VLFGLAIIAWLSPRAAWAQVPAAMAAGAAAQAGGSHAITYEGARRLVGEQPRDWIDPRTGSSNALASGCGVVAEVTLSVTSVSAYIEVMLQNESREVLAFEPGATLLVLASGAKRRLKTTITGDLQIEPGWNNFLPLELPDKADLKGQSLLAVELLVKSPSFGPCRLTPRIVRPPGPSREETYTRYTTLEIDLSFGGRVGTGGQRDLSPRLKPSMGFGFDFFFSLHHGATFDMTLDFDGERAARRATPAASFNGRPALDATGFFLGYDGRLPLANWLALTYSPEFGVMPFQITDESKDKVRLTSAVFCPRQRLRLVAWLTAAPSGSIFAGLALGHTYVPYGKLGEARLAGNLLSALVTFGVGG